MSRNVKVNQELAKQIGSACLCLALQSAARTVARSYDDALRSLDLTNGQFSLLMSLAREKPLTIGELAPRLWMDRTTLTAYLKPLERRGLIEVVPNPNDGRSRILVLSDQGRKLLSKAVPLWESVQQEFMSIIPAQDLETMKLVLRNLSRYNAKDS
jgi:DNA-binding MarR family transcriptional regulator